MLELVCVSVLSKVSCIYKGRIYNQGQTWQDGCDLDCECTDAADGVYRCTDRWVHVLTFNLVSASILVSSVAIKLSIRTSWVKIHSSTIEELFFATYTVGENSPMTFTQ